MQHPNSITSLKFFTAGRACFTVDNGKDGAKHKYYTFLIKRREFSKDKIRYFVFLLTSPDDYSYLGQLNPSSLYCHTTKKSTLTPSSAPFKAINWALRLVKENITPPVRSLIIHEGRCARCGRKLTVPASIAAGFGPQCAQRLGIAYGEICCPVERNQYV